CACRSVVLSPRCSFQGGAVVEPALVEQVLVAGRAQPQLERVAAVDAVVDAEEEVAAFAAVHRALHLLRRRLRRLGVGRRHIETRRAKVSSTSISPTAISKPDVAAVRSTTLAAGVGRSGMV